MLAHELQRLIKPYELFSGPLWRSAAFACKVITKLDSLNKASFVFMTKLEYF